MGATPGLSASALKQARDVLMAALSERAPDLDRHVRDVAHMAVAVGERIGLEEYWRKSGTRPDFRLH